MGKAPLELSRVNAFTLGKQRLLPERRGGPVEGLCQDTGGLHATGVTTPYLSLFARSLEFERTDLDAALYEHRSLGKIRCVRKTVFVQPADALPSFFQATAAGFSRGIEAFLNARGVSMTQFQAVSSEIDRLLTGREMTTSGIREALGSELDISAILNILCDQGILIRGRPESSWMDRRQYYARFRDYFPQVNLDGISQDDGIRDVVRRHVRAFGPVTEDDVIWWCGLGKGKARKALKQLKGDLAEVSVDGLAERHLLLREQLGMLEAARPPAQPVANLLPVLDGYVMGYQRRERYLDDAWQPYAFDRSGNATSLILVSGRAAGVWDWTRQGEPAVLLLLFKALPRDVEASIWLEAGRCGRFIFGREVEVRKCQSMVPLTKRSAGSMMAPLKEC